MAGFSDVIGHGSIIDRLKSSVTSDRVSHAYIFSGPDGCGKMMMAKAFAAALNCDEQSGDACGVCMSCMQAETDNHPDIIVVKKTKSVVSVDDIRSQLVNDIEVRPYNGRYKIYIVDEAEKMNEPAQNALLKTLEEPPAYAVIILLTSSVERFLPTIMSRSVMLSFNPLPFEMVAKRLSDRFDANRDEAMFLAAYSCGNIGLAEAAFSSSDFRDRSFELIRFLSAAKTLDMGDVNIMAARLSAKDYPVSDALRLMELWFRDLLLFKSSHASDRLVFLKYLSEIESLSECYSFAELSDILSEIVLSSKKINANVNKELVIELLLIKMVK